MREGSIFSLKIMVCSFMLSALSVPAFSASGSGTLTPAMAEAAAGASAHGGEQENAAAAPEANDEGAVSRKRASGSEGLPAPRGSFTQLPEKLALAAKRLRVNPAGITISVVPVENPGKPLLSWRADAMEPPASAAKLVTTLAALEVLGSSYRWRTNFYVKEMPDKKGVLKGGLYIRGGGDPALVLEDFALEADRLAQKGVRRGLGGLRVLTGLHALPEDLLRQIHAVGVAVLAEGDGHRDAANRERLQLRLRKIGGGIGDNANHMLKNPFVKRYYTNSC